MPAKVLVVIGTRPEAIKLAPVIHELRRRAEQIATRVLLTGQHQELLAPLVEYFDLRPDLDLRLMSPGQSPAAFTARALAALDEQLQRERPDWLVIQGDTATVLAASLAGFLHRVPILHVEAGLRSGALDEPWPEEFNRRVATLATTLHAAPTERAAQRLLAEGIEPANIRVTGNPVIDALQFADNRESLRDGYWREKYPTLGDKPVVLVTAHRRENLGPRLKQITAAIAQLARRRPECAIVWPVHPHPEVRATVTRDLAAIGNVHLIEPVEYAEFVWLMRRASLIISDSGGIQEEAPALGKPVLVLRDVTERPEALETGWVELVGVEPTTAVSAAEAWLSGERQSPESGKQPFGDGHAAVRIVDWLSEQVEQAARPVK
ncbi:MAG: UDP-N-acetylglucosamine 2-epimerase (non-hydrolyzing) [Planctomycetaceae bacterium]|nr:UDP-N-acetylglucosamine 2-epimerase (non-hydrolyzing) [Planctomycetaceae bacterium]